MAIKIFSIKNKATGKIERLVKAETKGQVNKHLAASVEIESIGAVEIVELMSQNALVVEDATAQATDDTTANNTGVEPAVTSEPASSPSPQATELDLCSDTVASNV